MGPTSKKNENDEKQKGIRKDQNGIRREIERNFLNFFSSSLLSQIHENLSIRIRRDKHGKCSTRRELRMSTKITGFRRISM